MEEEDDDEVYVGKWPGPTSKFVNGLTRNSSGLASLSPNFPNSKALCSQTIIWLPFSAKKENRGERNKINCELLYIKFKFKFFKEIRFCFLLLWKLWIWGLVNIIITGIIKFDKGKRKKLMRALNELEQISGLIGKGQTQRRSFSLTYTDTSFSFSFLALQLCPIYIFTHFFCLSVQISPRIITSTILMPINESQKERFQQDIKSHAS